MKVLSTIKEHRAAFSRRFPGERMTQQRLADEVSQMLGREISRVTIAQIENQESQYIDKDLQEAIRRVLNLSSIADLWQIQENDPGKSIPYQISA